MSRCNRVVPSKTEFQSNLPLDLSLSKDNSGPNFLPRRLFQAIGNVPASFSKKNEDTQTRASDSSPSKHRENVKGAVDYLKFDNKDSPNEGPEIDSPFCRNLLKSSQIGRKSKSRVLGRGSFGFVIFGVQKGNKIAVKITKTEKSRKGEHNAVDLSHPNIVKILHIYDSDKSRVVVMEYAGSRNLQELLSNSLSDIPWSFRLRCVLEVTAALAYCHEKGVIHRDVKPANVVVSSKSVCKLTDFGCSLSLNDFGQRLPQTENPKGGNGIVGTVPYLSPEVLRGHTTTTKADIYAVGIIIWQLVTRSVPFEGEAAHSIIYKVVAMNARPSLPSTPGGLSKRFLNIAKLCWLSKEDQRPTAPQLYKMLRDI